MNLLFWSSPEAIVLLPAAFCAFGVCAAGSLLLPEPFCLLQAVREMSAVAATVSASAREFMRFYSFFVLRTKWPRADRVPSRGHSSRHHEQLFSVVQVSSEATIAVTSCVAGLT